MKNIVYIIAIILWVLSLISKSKKKQQQTLDRERMRTLNKRVAQRTDASAKIVQRSSDAPAMFFPDATPQQPETDYESAYASDDYAADKPDGLKSAPLNSTANVEDSASLYRKYYGSPSSLGTESPEEKEAYDKEKQVIPKFTFGDASIKQYVIASEILGKPKALRR